MMLEFDVGGKRRRESENLLPDEHLAQLLGWSGCQRDDVAPQVEAEQAKRTLYVAPAFQAGRSRQV